MTDDICTNCSAVNTLLNGVCCSCGWNNTFNRPADEDERQGAADALDGAIADLEVFLGQDVCSEEDASNA